MRQRINQWIVLYLYSCNVCMVYCDFVLNILRRKNMTNIIIKNFKYRTRSYINVFFSDEIIMCYFNTENDNRIVIFRMRHGVIYKCTLPASHKMPI